MAINLPISNSTSNSTSNIFSAGKSNDDSSLIIDSEGNVIVKKLVLLDDKTGGKWEVKISDGEIYLEPLEKSDKRDFKIKKILND